MTAARRAGPILVIAILPLWQYGMRSHEQQPTWSRPAGGKQVNWILATGHSSGTIKVWDGRGARSSLWPPSRPLGTAPAGKLCFSAQEHDSGPKESTENTPVPARAGWRYELKRARGR